MNAEEQKDLLGEELLNVDDLLIDRSTGGRFNNSTFFGLAVMCGSIGMASFMSASSPMESSVSSKLYSGQHLTETDNLSIKEPVSIKNQGEEIVDHFVEQSPWQNLQLAFELIIQALMTMPAMAYISFALSLVFMVMWLINPLSYMATEDNHVMKKVRKSSRNQKHRNRGQMDHRRNRDQHNRA